MKVFRGHGWAWVSAAAFLVVPAIAGASDCNLQTTPCVSPGCADTLAGGCAPTAVAHQSGDPCGAGGTFNLSGTQYEMNCDGNTPFGLPACASSGVASTLNLPPVRFWQHGNYTAANYGCPVRRPESFDWIINAKLDAGIAAVDGRWILYQGNWNGPTIDGCNTGGRTDLEIGDIYPAPREGTSNHGSWYLAVSVPLASGYDFDAVVGAPAGGCSAKDFPVTEVPGVLVGGKTAGGTCLTDPSRTAGTANANPAYFDIAVTLEAPSTRFWTETSPAAPNIIDGYQIMFYQSGTTVPTSSLVGLPWNPVRDPTDPTRAAAYVPYGTGGSVTVSLPITTSTNDYYLAARLVYAGGTGINPSGTWDPATVTAGPRFVSNISRHCGPVMFGGVTAAVHYDKVNATRNADGTVTVKWTTLSEDDTNGFVVYRSTDATGTESVESVGGFIEAMGASHPYEARDEWVSRDTRTTYYYHVQELTAMGFGDRSPVVKVEAAATSTTGATGGRSRSSARRGH